MTDKEIIIDGVDVSGCSFYDLQFRGVCIACSDDEICINYCTEEQNCYYKQLQRTTAQYNAVVEQNNYLQSELLLARSEVNRKIHDIHKIQKALEECKRDVESIEIKHIESLLKVLTNPQNYTISTGRACGKSTKIAEWKKAFSEIFSQNIKDADTHALAKQIYSNIYQLNKRNKLIPIEFEEKTKNDAAN